MTKAGHYVVVLVLLSALAAAVLLLTRSQARAVANAPSIEVLDIPPYIGQCQQLGEDEEVDEYTARVLETSSILIRDYLSPEGYPVQLTIVYAGTTRRSLHFPELCLVGAGWEVRDQDVTDVGFLFNAKRLVLISGEKQQAVLYWFKTGDNMTGNYFVNAAHWAKNQLTFGTSTSAMIKLTAMIRPGREEAAFAVLERFAMQLAPVLRKGVP